MNRDIEPDENTIDINPEGNISTADIVSRKERKVGRFESRVSAESKTLQSEVLTTSQTPANSSAPYSSAAATAPARTSVPEHEEGPLFAADEASRFRARWDAIQVGFVDEPRAAVEQADNLVAETITRLAQVFADERKTLEQQWSAGNSVSTEDLRLALRRYRSFFGRLLAV